MRTHSGTLLFMRTPEVLSFREFRAGLAATLKRVQGEGPVFVGSHRKPEAVIMSVAHYQDLVEISERRAAIAEALASVRAEGLEPSEIGLRGLAAISDGTLTTDEFRAEILRRYRR
jgi:prevent-host-death family protein